MQAKETNHPLPVQGLRRWIFIGLGWSFVGLAVLGVFLPLLPTTPFVLLASYFFVRSSPRLHTWLHRSRLFGQLLRDWEKHRGVRRHVKILAVFLIVAVIGGSIAFGNLSWPLVGLLVGLGLIGVIVVLRLRVVESVKSFPSVEPPLQPRSTTSSFSREL